VEERERIEREQERRIELDREVFKII